ncbi:MAG: hypothetical protein ACJASQ_004288 [Crocinitomicaceae bacterium]|jgi:hypothetical protein
MRYLTLLLVFIQFSSLAQNGLYGRRHSIELKTVSYFPIMQRLFVYNVHGNGYKYDEELDEFEETISKFNTGVHFQYSFAFKKNRAIGFNVGMDFWNSPGISETIYGWNGYVSVLRSEQLSMRTFSFVPLFEISTVNSSLPTGLSHQFGIGMTNTKVVERTYAGHYGDDLIPGTEEFEDDYAVNRFGIQALYALKMRSPIGKRLMVNYGARYMFNYTFKRSAGTSIDRNVRKHLVFNIISFELGLGYAL